MTIVAMALPMILVIARPSLINLSIPRINAIEATGMFPSTDKTAARVIKPLPVTPARLWK